MKVLVTVQFTADFPSVSNALQLAQMFRQGIEEHQSYINVGYPAYERGSVQWKAVAARDLAPAPTIEP